MYREVGEGKYARRWELGEEELCKWINVGIDKIGNAGNEKTFCGKWIDAMRC